MLHITYGISNKDAFWLCELGLAVVITFSDGNTIESRLFESLKLSTAHLSK